MSNSWVHLFLMRCTLPQVNYVGKSVDLYKDAGYQLSGSSFVINKMLGTTWLWDRVRVSGGAYGGFSSFDSSHRPHDFPFLPWSQSAQNGSHLIAAFANCTYIHRLGVYSLAASELISWRPHSLDCNSPSKHSTVLWTRHFEPWAGFWHLVMLLVLSCMSLMTLQGASVLLPSNWPLWRIKLGKITWLSAPDCLFLLISLRIPDQCCSMYHCIAAGCLWRHCSVPPGGPDGQGRLDKGHYWHNRGHRRLPIAWRQGPHSLHPPPAEGHWGGEAGEEGADPLYFPCRFQARPMIS